MHLAANVPAPFSRFLKGPNFYEMTDLGSGCAGLGIALFGNRGTAWTPAQSVAIVCSTTRVWSCRSGTTPWITMSVARPTIMYHQVWAITMSSLLGNPSSLATSKKNCTKRSNNGAPRSSIVFSSADAVAVLRPEVDVAELLWMGNGELNQAA